MAAQRVVHAVRSAPRAREQGQSRPRTGPTNTTEALRPSRSGTADRAIDHRTREAAARHRPGGVFGDECGGDQNAS